MSDRALEELGARLRAKNRLNPHVLHKPQRDFVYDQSRLVMACTSRRAGKSVGLGFAAAKAADKYAGAIIPYVTQAREIARDIIWPAMEMLDDKLELGLRFKQNTGDIVWPNGTRMVLRGCGTKREIEKLRGIKCPEAFVDEAQGIPTTDLLYLIGDVLTPALLDYKGRIRMTGTPNAACAGYFYEAYHGQQNMDWSVHRWTMRDNPHIPDVEEQLQQIRKANGWTEATPAYQREYCGCWIRDSEGLVFKLRDHVNIQNFDESAADDWEYTLGIDVGFSDPTAFAVLASSRALNKCWVVESFKEPGMLPAAVAVEVDRFSERYDFHKLIIDGGGFGKTYAEDLRQTYKLPVEPAMKHKKASHIEMLNSDLMSGALMIDPSNRALLDEMRLLQWNQDKLERNVMQVDDRRFADHLCDAMLYAWRMQDFNSYGYEIESPVVGSDKWLQMQEDRLEEAAERRFDKNGERDWFSD